jgi:hypothetical protein
MTRHVAGSTAVRERIGDEKQTADRPHTAATAAYDIAITVLHAVDIHVSLLSERRMTYSLQD